MNELHSALEELEWQFSTINGSATLEHLCSLTMPVAGHGFESPHVDVEIFRLLTLVAASPKLAQLQNDVDLGHRWRALRCMEEPELSRLLVSIAAIVRTGLDADREAFKRQADQPVGVLYVDLRKYGVAEVLTLREACNKILHAEEVIPDRIPASTTPRDFEREPLSPIVQLYGSRRKERWWAQLDVLRFGISAIVAV